MQFLVSRGFLAANIFVLLISSLFWSDRCFAYPPLWLEDWLEQPADAVKYFERGHNRIDIMYKRPGFADKCEDAMNYRERVEGPGISLQNHQPPPSRIFVVLKKQRPENAESYEPEKIKAYAANFIGRRNGINPLIATFETSHRIRLRQSIEVETVIFNTVVLPITLELMINFPDQERLFPDFIDKFRYEVFYRNAAGQLRLSVEHVKEIARSIVEEFWN